MQHKNKTNLIIVFIELNNKNMKYTVCKNTIQINFLFFETNNNLFVKFFFYIFLNISFVRKISINKKNIKLHCEY